MVRLLTSILGTCRPFTKPGTIVVWQLKNF